MSKQSNADVPVVNRANALTVVRLVLVPVFIVMVLRGNDMGMLVATAVFTVAALTDKLDGYLARRLNLITNFGKLADPIADKALTMSALVLLSCLGQLWWWVTIVIIVRELGITFMRMAMVRKGAVMAASKGGKLKTTLQMVAIVGLLMPWQMFLPDAISSGLIATALCIMMVALLVTVVTGVDYVQQAITLNRAKEAK